MVQPYDEQNIKNEDLLIRRVDPTFHVVWDENRGVRRISTKLYKASSEGSRSMSVDLHKLIVQAKLEPKQFVTNPRYLGSVCFAASVARKAGLVVGYEVMPENKFHGGVWRLGEQRTFSRGQEKALQTGASWFVEIPGVELA